MGWGGGGGRSAALSHVDRVSRCWNGPLSQNVSYTQQIGRSSDLSTAPLSTADTSGPAETFLHTHNADTWDAPEHVHVSLQVHFNPSECVFFSAALEMNPSALCPHFDTWSPRPLWSIQRNLFLSNATSLTENAWKAFTRPTLFLRPVKMHMETLLKEKPGCSAVGENSGGWRIGSLEVGEQKSALIFMKYGIGVKYSTTVALFF